MDLSTTYMGMKLRTPIVPSASPLSEEISGIKRLEDAGASAIVLYSLFEEQLRLEQLELHDAMTAGTESYAESLTYFPQVSEYRLGPEEYLNHIRKAKDSVSIPVIASLNGTSVGGWTDYAKKIQQSGADGLELNIYYIPTDADLVGSLVEDTYIDIVTEVKRAISIPLAVKLSPFFSNFAHFSRRLDVAGADALVLFNRFYQPDIDLESLEVTPNLHLSTPQDLRLPLTWVGILFGKIKASLAGTSGISTHEDVLKMLMAGANVTMMASALLRHGTDHIRTVEQNLIQWMDEHEYESVQQMIGSMSQKHSSDPSAFERAQYMKAIRKYE